VAAKPQVRDQHHPAGRAGGQLETLSAAYREVRTRLAWEPVVLGADIDLGAALRIVLAVARTIPGLGTR
jgi:hypothetical protein